MPKEFHVEFTEKGSLSGVPEWSVRYGEERAGSRGWDKRIAIGFAKARAKEEKAATVFVHNRLTGEVERTFEFLEGTQQ
jgi:hypothetical protein